MKFLINFRRWVAWQVICPELKAEVVGLCDQLRQAHRVLEVKDRMLLNFQGAMENAKADLELMHAGQKPRGEMGRPFPPGAMSSWDGDGRVHLNTINEKDAP